MIFPLTNLMHEPMYTQRFPSICEQKSTGRIQNLLLTSALSIPIQSILYKRHQSSCLFRGAKKKKMRNHTIHDEEKT